MEKRQIRKKYKAPRKRFSESQVLSQRKLVGKRVNVIEKIDNTLNTGRVKIEEDTCRAVSRKGLEIPSGKQVFIKQVIINPPNSFLVVDTEQ